jgi:hypothetical protein
MRDPQSTLQALGGLHDGVVRRIVWLPEGQRLEIDVDDLYSNFVGLAQYPGRKPGTVLLDGITRFEIEVEFAERTLNIEEFSMICADAGTFIASITFWPTGRIVVHCRAVTMPEVLLPR